MAIDGSTVSVWLEQAECDTSTVGQGSELTTRELEGDGLMKPMTLCDGLHCSEEGSTSFNLVNAVKSFAVGNVILGCSVESKATTLLKTDSAFICAHRHLFVIPSSYLTVQASAIQSIMNKTT